MMRHGSMFIFVKMIVETIRILAGQTENKICCCSHGGLDNLFWKNHYIHEPTIYLLSWAEESNIVFHVLIIQHITYG